MLGIRSVTAAPADTWITTAIEEEEQRTGCPIYKVDLSACEELQSGDVAAVQGHLLNGDQVRVRLAVSMSPRRILF